MAIDLTIKASCNVSQMNYIHFTAVPPEQVTGAAVPTGQVSELVLSVWRLLFHMSQRAFLLRHMPKRLQIRASFDQRDHFAYNENRAGVAE
jgi:hypothetical protein